MQLSLNVNGNERLDLILALERVVDLLGSGSDQGKFTLDRSASCSFAVLIPQAALAACASPQTLAVGRATRTPRRSRR